jgi:hypothetical protein
MLYRIPRAPVNDVVRTINGRGLRHRRLDRPERAHLAASCVTGKVQFRLSIEQAALLFDVPRALVRKHLKANGNGSAETRHTLADHLRESTPQELIEAARAIGVDRIWDQMIAPVVVEERGATSR